MSRRTYLPKRGRKGGSYAQRDRRGRFKDITNIGRGINLDKRKKAKKKGKKSKPGHGHQLDYPK